MSKGWFPERVEGRFDELSEPLGRFDELSEPLVP
jgi:hypothetical protein